MNTKNLVQKDLCCQSINIDSLKNVVGGWLCIVDADNPGGKIHLTDEEISYLKNVGFKFKKDYFITQFTLGREVFSATQLVINIINFTNNFAGVIKQT